MISSTLGNLKILIGADASGVASGVKDAESSIAKLGSTVERHALTFAKMGIAAAAAGAVLAAAFVHTSSEAIDKQSKLARQLGGTVEGIQALERQADLAGVSSEELTKAADKLNRKLGEATRDGMSPAADGLKRIGLNAKDLSKLDVDTRFGAIADAIQKTGLNSQQTADLLGQLGVRAGKLSNMLEDGGKAFREAREDVRLFGVAVSNFDAKQIERANDAFTVFKLAMKGIGNQLAVEISAPMEAAATAFRNFVKDSGGLGNVVGPQIEKLIYLAGSLDLAFYNLRQSLKDPLDLKITLQVPDWLTKLTGWTGQVEVLNQTAAKTAAAAGTPPDPQKWVDYWRVLQNNAKIAGITIEAISERLRGAKNDPADVDGLASKEREALEKKLQALKKSLATEAQALAEARTIELKQIDEFDQKKIGTTEERNALRLDAERKYRDSYRDLVASKLTDEIATETELENQKYAKKLETLAAFEAARTDQAELWAATRKKIETKHATDLQLITAKGYSSLANVVDSAMSNITQITGDESEKGFTIMKAISSATAVVKGYEAAVSAYASGEKIIPGSGPVWAGIALAGTAAYIAKLNGVTSSTSSTSSTGSSSSTASTASSSSGGSSGDSGSSSNGRSLVVELRGRSRYSADEIRDLMRDVEAWRADGGTTGDRVTFR